MLSGDDPEQDPTSGEAEQQPKSVKRSIKELAEHLNIDPDELYSAEVTIGDETVSVGKLKDAFASSKKAEIELFNREETILHRETAMLRDQQLMNLVLQDLKSSLKPETVNVVMEKLAAHEGNQRQLMQAAMPELADPDVMKAFRADVVETLQAYGFQPHEMAISDHRILVMLRDMLRLKQSVKRVQDIEKQKSPPPNSIKGGRYTEPQRRTKPTTESGRIAAVSAMLKGT